MSCQDAIVRKVGIKRNRFLEFRSGPHGYPRGVDRTSQCRFRVDLVYILFAQEVCKYPL